MTIRADNGRTDSSREELMARVNGTLLGAEWVLPGVALRVLC